MIIVPKGFTPREYQLPVLQKFDSGCKRIILRFARRAGKDVLCLALTAKAMLQRKGLYYYVYPEIGQGRKALWEAMDIQGNRLLDMIPDEVIEKKNDNEMLLKLINGSILRVVGSERIDNL